MLNKTLQWSIIIRDGVKGTMRAAIQVWNALRHIVYIRRQIA